MIFYSKPKQRNCHLGRSPLNVKKAQFYK